MLLSSCMNKLMAEIRLALGQPMNQIFLFIVVLIIFLGGLMNYLLGKPARDKVLEVGLQQQLVAAKSGTAAVETFVDLVGRSLETMATRSLIMSMDQGSRKQVEDILKHWEGTAFVGMGIVDAKGKMLIVANSEENRVGEGDDFSQRGYFQRALTSDGRYVVGEVIVSRAGATVGSNILPIAVPIIVKGEKRGVLVGGITLSKLTDDYFKRILLPAGANTFLVRKDGVIGYSNSQELIGKNIYEELSNTSIPFGSAYIAEQSRKILAEGKEDVLKLTLPAKGKLENFLIAYVPVNWNSQEKCDCLLAVMVPAREIIGTAGPIYVRQMMVVVIAFLALTALAIRVAKVVGCSEGLREREKRSSGN